MSNGPFAGLARHTGFSEEFLADLSWRGELDGLIRELETRSRPGNGPHRLAEITRKRYPKEPRSGRAALMEMLAKRFPEWEADYR